MNRDEIIAKWAGMTARERDAWIAEVVFGWEWREPDGEDVGWYERLNNAPFYDRVFTGRRRGWSPSTYISAAWAVFELLRKDWLPGIQDCAMFGYRVDLQSDYEYREDIGGVVAKTAPEAICLAALIAKLTEVSADVAV
ncbi:hypothetical protein MKY63_00970 [Paenibacillus sp. FSL R7-0189]|uniref:BC1872 family protein n=1 Tax=Paenibacillus sp. FSL R7-0189 TaxID=2921673 RepID=UPI0030DA3583